MAFFVSIAFALLLILTSWGLQAWRRAFRRRKLQGLELKPNCLLTRYPIAFLSGPRSLFRLFDHWNDIPVFLREHGYDVIEIEPRAELRSREEWASLLKALPDKCHLIADASQELALERIAEGRHPHVVSLTLVRNADRKDLAARGTSRLRAEDLRPAHATAIEVFELPGLLSGGSGSLVGGSLVGGSSAGKSSVSAPSENSFVNCISRGLLAAHNLLRAQSGRWVDPIETGAVVGFKGWFIESRFLDLAISLAERDAMGSDHS